jgi:hypothetical protein
MAFHFKENRQTVDANKKTRLFQPTGIAGDRRLLIAAVISFSEDG